MSIKSARKNTLCYFKALVSISLATQNLTRDEFRRTQNKCKTSKFFQIWNCFLLQHLLWYSPLRSKRNVIHSNYDWSVLIPNVWHKNVLKMERNDSNQNMITLIMMLLILMQNRPNFTYRTSRLVHTTQRSDRIPHHRLNRIFSICQRLSCPVDQKSPQIVREY